MKVALFEDDDDLSKMLEDMNKKIMDELKLPKITDIEDFNDELKLD